MIYFFKLIRPVNLLIITLSMVSLGLYFDVLLVDSGMDSVLFSFSFFLLVFSTVLIAAAGNIINDYFDVSSDRINRPDRVIIGKYINRRWAILLHWVTNVIAFIIAGYLSYEFKTFWYLFIHLLSINLLWYYSMFLKRTFFIGNITIAFLTALVPLLVGIFYNQQIKPETFHYYYPFNLTSLLDYPIYLSVGLGIFAFLLNWSREIIKDIEDKKGDKLIRAKTIPIVLGVKKAKIFSVIVLMITILMSFLFLPAFSYNIIGDPIAFIPMIFAGLIMILAIYFTIISKTRQQIRIGHRIIKIIMVIGMFLPLYWVILLKFIN